MGHILRSTFILCFIAMTSGLWVFANDCHGATLLGVEVVSTDQWSDVLVRLDEEVAYQHAYLSAGEATPARCYIDLYDTSRSHAVPSRQFVDGQLISKVRTGVYATKLRVVLDLNEECDCSVVSLTEGSLQLRVSAIESASPEKVVELHPQPAIRTEGRTSEITNVPENVTAEQNDTQSSLLTSSAKGNASAWGWLQLYAAHDTKKDRYEDHELQRLTARTGADWEKELNTASSLELHAAVEVDRIFYDSDSADDDTDFDLHETYLQVNQTDWDVSFGKQRVRWGKSDQLSPVDSVNPQDFRQFITVDLEERALPSWMLRGRWHGDSVGLETIIQPWFKESELEYFDSDWALYRNLRQSITDNPQTPAGLKEYVRNLRVDEDKPSDSLENTAAAARLTLRTDQSDYALSYHYGWETMPTIKSFPVKNINYSGGVNIDPGQQPIFTDENVQSEYKRQHTVGFEWETVVDPLGFRGEVAYIDHVAFLSKDFTSNRKPVVHLVSGIDYVSATEWYFNVQGSWLHIDSYTSDILFFEEDNVSVLGEISKPVWRGNLEFAAQYNYTITDQSSYLRPYAILKYFRNLECEIGANIFSGDDDTLLGSYDQADQVYARIKLFF